MKYFNSTPFIFGFLLLVFAGEPHSLGGTPEQNCVNLVTEQKEGVGLEIQDAQSRYKLDPLMVSNPVLALMTQGVQATAGFYSRYVARTSDSKLLVEVLARGPEESEAEIQSRLIRLLANADALRGQGNTDFIGYVSAPELLEVARSAPGLDKFIHPRAIAFAMVTQFNGYGWNPKVGSDLPTQMTKNQITRIKGQVAALLQSIQSAGLYTSNPQYLVFADDSVRLSRLDKLEPAQGRTISVSTEIEALTQILQAHQKD